MQECVSRLVKLNVIASRQDELTFVIENLVPFIEEFEQCVNDYEQRKTSSVADFNYQMNKLGLANDNSLIYIFPKKTLEEKSHSCEYIACSFAPTFPKDKYKEREEYLQPKTVLTFLEAPGTGKYIVRIIIAL